MSPAENGGWADNNALDEECEYNCMESPVSQLMHRECRKVLEKLASVVQRACSLTRAKIQPDKTKSKRCLPDFSDIAHLAISFQGICLPSEQMNLVKEALERWSCKAHSTPGEMAHLYIRDRYPNMRLLFDKYSQLTSIYQDTVTNIIEMVVESADSLGCFNRSYWRKVCEALCELPHQFPRMRRRSEVTLAWRIIILFLFCKIEYAMELRHRCVQAFHSYDNPCYIY
ncbi:unnamed protein product [Gongylonema pulchrum]|uniref:Ras-GEF domain-containing protein n=1 Tax=Gongylonema pulchrum TaxID=637853 RepID=A0A183D204_9BILA|nr:unnamed protein product [Gongylonema pulchrum]